MKDFFAGADAAAKDASKTHSTFIVTGLVDAFKSIDWGGVLKATGFAASLAAAIGGAFIGAVKFIGGLLGGGGPSVTPTGPVGGSPYGASIGVLTKA